MEKDKSPTCAVIIVTYNSGLYLDKAMLCLQQQTQVPQQIILVDTGSTSYDYLEPYKSNNTVHIVHAEKGAGFCKGNNIGFSYVQANTDYVFLLNPDAFLTPCYIEEAIHFMEEYCNRDFGAVTGLTLGYDIQKDQPTGKYDTTGVFTKWFGRWYDRGQGQIYDPTLYQKKEIIPAICGAIFFCRKTALDQVLIRGKEIFDSHFFMYKEDIDLSLRLRRQGWKLAFHPKLIAYHCRGWNPDRSKMPRQMRLCSAYNEWRIHLRHRAPIPLLYSTLKWASVKWFDW